MQPSLDKGLLKNEGIWEEALQDPLKKKQLDGCSGFWVDPTDRFVMPRFLAFAFCSDPYRDTREVTDPQTYKIQALFIWEEILQDGADVWLFSYIL